ncbi:MAG: monovalent cation/H(+) antiporter subunit G [Kiritimatiellae bacterium]|nr:monovalent cation/H(+) antiporter subunit G [Kiritimatiellia bacterium]MDW8457781.1 monovalent cation/H(+) antiporter subunit G [Verrucomicrobiota bacterium]
MTALELVAAALMAVGGFFFFAGTVGFLRFPDFYTRLHALTKADNLGFGLTGAGLALLSESWVVAAKILLIWILLLISASACSLLIARGALRNGIKPWRKP